MQLLQWAKLVKQELPGTQVQSTQELLDVLHAPGCLDTLMVSLRIVQLKPMKSARCYREVMHYLWKVQTLSALWK